ncbi:hypothetical protein [Acaryochloris sp. IP29b_bin.148]|uniref:hypothetical protein n=1 Tax=Acaryochloris sp. IP29b_bin.148 TaxID=2969218 RepID=UPI002606FFB3|nr:hypothetical protein [Acaryochloris sp. IP29b_bin.148]
MITKPNLHQPQHTGFTLVEVLVGLLVITGFISTAMQALVTATAFKVKGQELSEATTWIQEDIERVRFEAKRLGLGEDVNLPACQTLDNTSGYAALLQARIEQNAPVDTDKLSVIGNRPYTLTRTPTLSSDAPFNVLSLEYEVVSADSIPIAIVQTKVIPDKSLECP